MPQKETILNTADEGGNREFKNHNRRAGKIEETSGRVREVFVGSCTKLGHLQSYAISPCLFSKNAKRTDLCLPY
jgi:hypothetical protein